MPSDEIVSYYENEQKCNYLTKNSTRPSVLYPGFGYIPETFVIDACIYLGVIVLFSFLRKRAWNYGRLALVQSHDSKWTRIFYGDQDDDRERVEDDNVSVDSDGFDRGFFSWILASIRLKDDQIIKKSGLDAVQYLSFQRHVMVFMAIICVVSLTVILPINIEGHLEADNKPFAKTTISNLDPRSELLWAHVTLAFLMLPLAVICMRQFSRKLKFLEDETSRDRAIMILHIPRNTSSVARLEQHFREAYPDFVVSDIQLAYKVKSLQNLDYKRKTVIQNLTWCQNYLIKNEKRVTMTKYANACGCCRCGKIQEEFDAIEYYTEELTRLSTEIEEETVIAKRNPAGIAFVTFEARDMANRVYDDYHKVSECCRHTPSSSVSIELESYAWEIKHAPEPEDIQWANLSSNVDYWYVRAFAVNCVLFVVLFFLTTPFIIVNSINLYFFIEKINILGSLLSEYLPSLLLLSFAGLMPVVVSFSDRLLKHWTLSEYNHSVMRKTYVFLLFMVVILPSLGLTSGKALVEWFIKQNDNDPSSKFRWECLFLPDNGAFFVNYVIASCFFGTSVELMRLPELMLYVLGLLSARNIAERANVKKQVLFEFAFGVNYSWMMLNVAMTLIYCLICPMITPFGLLYICVKHFTDRYNLYFAYAPSKINKRMHFTAINFLIVNVIIMQIVLLFFLTVRKGTVGDIKNADAIVVVMTIGCFAVVILFGVHLFFNVFKSLTAVGFKTLGREEAFNLFGENLPSASSSTTVLKFYPEVLPPPEGTGSQARKPSTKKRP